LAKYGNYTNTCAAYKRIQPFYKWWNGLQLFFSLEVSKTDLCKLEAVAKWSVFSIFWVDFLCLSELFRYCVRL